MEREDLIQLAESLMVEGNDARPAIRSQRDMVPWMYDDIARRYLGPNSRVLDLGTGDGRWFLSQADRLVDGLGVSVEYAGLCATAQEAAQRGAQVRYVGSSAWRLPFAKGSIDVVLNRQAAFFGPEMSRVLRSGGVFITEQTGWRNARNICATFGCTATGRYHGTAQTVDQMAAAFESSGWHVVGKAEYDVATYFADAASLLLWLKRGPVPEDFDITRHWAQVQSILLKYSTARGIVTNEHRELLIVKKP